MIPIATLVGVLLLLMSAVGSMLLLWAVGLARRFERRPPVPARTDAVTLLKPLHGAEPRLGENLSSFLQPAAGAPVQMLCGVHHADDPAYAVAAALPCPRGVDVTLVVTGPARVANPKIGNLLAMLPAATADILILSDSDIAVAPNYLDRIVAALDQPGVGAVTCLYRGRGDAGFWSRIGALGLDLHFLPAALIGLRSGLAHPCMGSTIALRRETLARIGGFEALAGELADDYALGAKVRALDLKVVVPDMLVTHACEEPDFGALVRHELRWSATVARIDPAGTVGGIVLHPLPLALAGAALLGFGGAGLVTIALALVARAGMGWRLRRITGMRSASLAWIPLRDLLAFALYIAGFFVRSVDWRGRTLKMEGGLLTADTELPL